mgnify:CR=1 FL=1
MKMARDLVVMTPVRDLPGRLRSGLQDENPKRTETYQDPEHTTHRERRVEHLRIRLVAERVTTELIKFLDLEAMTTEI